MLPAAPRPRRARGGALDVLGGGGRTARSPCRSGERSEPDPPHAAPVRRVVAPSRGGVRSCVFGSFVDLIEQRIILRATETSQSVSQLFHGPAPRSPLHRLAVRLRHSRSNTSTERTRSRGLPNVRRGARVRHGQKPLSNSPSGQGPRPHRGTVRIRIHRQKHIRSQLRMLLTMLQPRRTSPPRTTQARHTPYRLPPRVGYMRIDPPGIELT